MNVHGELEYNARWGVPFSRPAAFSVANAPVLENLALMPAPLPEETDRAPLPEETDRATHTRAEEVKEENEGESEDEKKKRMRKRVRIVWIKD